MVSCHVKSCSFSLITEINISCPKAFSENIWWTRIDLGKTQITQCPSGTTGNATRYCDPRKSWQKADLRLCTTNEFINARKTVSLVLIEGQGQLVLHQKIIPLLHMLSRTGIMSIYLASVTTLSFNSNTLIEKVDTY